jgi:hypothetical protein
MFGVWVYDLRLQNYEFYAFVGRLNAFCVISQTHFGATELLFTAWAIILISGIEPADGWFF